MIFTRSNCQIQLIAVDVLGFCSILYLGSGLLYGYVLFDEINEFVVCSLLGCLIGWMFFRPRALKNSPQLSVCLKKSTQQILLAVAFFSIALMVLFWFINGADYIFKTKIDRSAAIAKYFYFRIPLYASMILLAVLYSDSSRILKRQKSVIFYLMLFVAFVEMNRELLVMMGLLFIIRHFFLYQRLLVPKGVFGFIYLFLLSIALLLVVKPLLYLIILKQEYDGGFINFGETVNWYRWLIYAEDNNVDLGAVQKNDFWYTINSIFLPYSHYDSASKIWFGDILGNEDVGRTFGYSGVLWLSYYFDGWWIMFPWFFLFFLYSVRWSRNNVIQIIFTVGLTLISFRFFRSEWPLVLKTFLWAILYPSFLIFIFSSLVRGGRRFVKTGNHMDDIT